MDELILRMESGARISSGGRALTFGFNSAKPGDKRGFSRRQRNGMRAQEPLPGVPPDVKAMTSLLRQQFGMQVEQHLVGHGGAYEKMDKRTVVNLLNKLFNDQSTNRFVIYVAGHGDGEEGRGAPIGEGGNWILDNYSDPDDQRYKTISLREIMTLWLAAKRKRSDDPQLTICHDVCFGGTWVAELKQIEGQAASELGVAVQASTTPTEEAHDGFFTEIFAKKQLVKDGRSARLDGELKRQHPMYHVAWRGPRGGKVDHMELNNGTKIKFYQHSGA